MQSIKKQTSKGVPPPPPPLGLPNIQDRISQLQFAARLHSAHEIRGGSAVAVVLPDDACGGRDAPKVVKKPKTKSLVQTRFLSKST